VGTKTKKAISAALNRSEKTLNSIEASSLRDGIAPRCHHACRWRQKSGGPELHSLVSASICGGNLHDCYFAKIKIGLNCHPWKPPAAVRYQGSKQTLGHLADSLRNVTSRHREQNGLRKRNFKSSPRRDAATSRSRHRFHDWSNLRRRNGRRLR
jgi:hypothetical protein